MVGAKKALCVGINKFKNLPRATLQGCVNDVKDMSGILKDILGFKDQDIVMLTDEKATKKNIMGNLNSMVEEAKAGNLNNLVFSFSSHGTQVPDISGDEPDRADEAFCPHDLAQKGNQWDPDHVILDDELHDLFIQLPQNVLLEVYMDTCHSGTGLKAADIFFDRTPRFLLPPSIEAFEKVDGRTSRGLHQALLEKGMMHHILWAACRADQTSADAKIDGDYHGAFTYYFCKEMRASQNKLSRSKLLKKVRADLKQEKYEQVPQLENQATARKSPVKVG